MSKPALRASVVVVAALLLAGCSGDEKSVSDDKTPEEVMELAATTLDETSGVTLSLSSEGLPDGKTVLKAADGVGTHAPAFDGTITVVLAGTDFNVPIVAVDDKVYAQIPLTPGWSEVDPADYGAPDPAQLMSTDAGFSALLTATDGVEEGDTVRGGEDNKEVLTEYTGTVPGDAVKNVIPSAVGRVRRDVHRDLRRRAARGGPDRRLLPRHRTDDLHDRLRRLRHREGDHRSMIGQPRVVLGLAAVAVAFAAADTYVVVLALPDMMAGVGVSPEELQRGAPIVSGFLLGYVAMLPLIGRIADLRGRVPVLVAALLVFAVGSLVTALSYDMPTMVGGRFLQGVGGGGLVPATLALVADIYPTERRGVPLGVVSAVQELGSVLGPLFGALVLAVADWRMIFLINLVVGLVLAAAIWTLRFGPQPQASPQKSRGFRPIDRSKRNRHRPDFLGAVLLLITLVAGSLVFTQPSQLLRDLTWGQLFIPFAGESRWLDAARARSRSRPPCSSSSGARPPSAPWSTSRAGPGPPARRTWSGRCSSRPRWPG